MKRVCFVFSALLFTGITFAKTVEVHTTSESRKRAEFAQTRYKELQLSNSSDCIVPNHEFDQWTMGKLETFSGATINYTIPVKWFPMYCTINSMFYDYPVYIKHVRTSSSEHAAGMYIGDYHVGADVATIFPCDSRPASITGLYKFTDSTSYAMIEVYLTKYHPNYDSTEMIGAGAYVVNSPLTNFSSFELPIYYNDSYSIPDTVIIIASYMSGEIGTEFIVDNIQFSEMNSGTGMSNNSIKEINVYPNPSAYYLNIELKELKGSAHASIIDVSGRVIEYQPVTKNNFSWSVSALNPGVYFLRIQDQENIYMKKFIKE